MAKCEWTVDLDDAEVTYWGDFSELAYIYAPVAWCSAGVLGLRQNKGRLGKQPGSHPTLYFPLYYSRLTTRK